MQLFVLAPFTLCAEKKCIYLFLLFDDKARQCRIQTSLSAQLHGIHSQKQEGKRFHQYRGNRKELKFAEHCLVSMS